MESKAENREGKVSGTTTLKIKGMSCASCAVTIEKSLKGLDGIIDANINLASEKALVHYDSDKVSLEDISKRIEDAGYGVEGTGEKVVFKVGGMTCASCAQTVEKALKGEDGVIEASVNLPLEKAIITYNPELTSIRNLKKAVSDTGYELLEPVRESGEDEELRKMRNARRRMAFAWLLTAPIILWMLPEMISGRAFPSRFVFDLGMIILAIPVMFWAGSRTLRSAFVAAIHGSANMDVLIAMGTFAALLSGVLTFFTPVKNYAGVAAMIMSFHLTGRYIEAKAKGRASQAIKKLLELGAKTARIVVDGEEKEVSIEEVEVGDIMVIRPGEKIPTDGIVVDGKSHVDESMATGESMPINRTEGDEVIGATINQQGVLRVKATKVGADTFLSQVIKMVEEYQGTKVPIQALADRVTAYFVPTILGIAALTFLMWIIFPGTFRGIVLWASSFIPWVDPSLGATSLAIFATIAVLVIACPCALGLATPTALMVGSGVGAENGILMRSGEAIQTMKDVRAIVFDKTGTITKGKPEVTDVVTADRDVKGDVLKIAASLEYYSEHPLGRAIVERAKREGIELLEAENFTAVSGKGIKANLNGSWALVGSRNLMEEEGVSYGSIESQLERLEEEAKTAVIVAYDGKAIGTIAIADTIKEDSAEAIAELEGMGLKSVMITGDNRKTAEAIAKKVGISKVVAEVLPDRKAAEVQNLQKEFGLVAMVGDGINDAPALTQANVGIAIGTGTDIAIESSDITLVSGELSAVVSAIKLSKATFRKIRQNLFWAFFYNIVAIPIAILGLLHPVIAEIAMAMSSINVVTNANRLRKVNIRPSYRE